MFRQKNQRDIPHRGLLDDVHDIIRNILDDETVWAELHFDPDYSAMLKSRVHSWEPTIDMLLAPCTGNADSTTRLRYQSTFVMARRSLVGLVPDYQAQSDAPKNEPFPMLKQASQPPMLKYERQLAVHDSYHSTIYKQ